MGVAGRIWQQEMIALDNDRRNNALMQNALVREQGLAQRQRETKEFEMLGKIFESFTKTMDEAATPAMKTILRERLSGVLVDVGKRSPFMFKALRARYPRDFRKLKTDAWLATNPPPMRQFQGQNPSENYTAFASDIVNAEKFQRRMRGAIDGEEIDIVGFHQIDEKMGVRILDNKGKSQLVNVEMENQDPLLKATAEKFGVTPQYLIENNYELPPETQVVDIGDEKVMISKYINAKNGKIRIAKQVLGERPGAGGGGAGGGAIKKPLPNNSIMEAIALIQSGSKDTDDVVALDLIDHIDNLQDQFQDNPARFAHELNRTLRNVDDRFTYVVTSPADMPAYSRGFFSRDLKLNDNTLIKFVRGDRTNLTTRDGVNIGVIYDPSTNNLANALGDPITDETFEQLQERVGISTAKELGVLQAPAPKKRTESLNNSSGVKNIKDLIQGLPKDIENWEVQMISQNGKPTPFLMTKGIDNKNKLQQLTPEQYELFYKHSDMAKESGSLQFIIDMYNQLPKESKIPVVGSRAR